MDGNSRQNLLDALTAVGFIIGMLNFEENLTQSDKQEIMSALDEKTQRVLTSIDIHLQMQDEKLNKILERLEVIEREKD